ncbi:MULTISPECIES: type VII secretion system-associated protein [Streptomyces]|uniref:Type VII secretion system-associated protein n=1 Tax=Streptomyces flaveolus TaxID=67297 RepID=A0ABV3AEL3_9ACTN|nr:MULTISPECIES: type VII secretion system-associated protein [Streptomyces]
MTEQHALGGRNMDPAPTDDTHDDSDSIALPIPPPEIISAARFARGQWLREVDPFWADEEDVPSWAIVGEWQTDSRGLIVAWRPNDDYRPSPLALGWAEPTDPVDEAMQAAATGFGPVGAVLEALVEAEEVAVLTTLDGSFVTALSHDGAEVVPVYTAPDQLLGVGRLTAHTAPVAELLDGLPDGHEFYLNPAGPVAMRVRTEALREAVREAVARSSAEAERPEDLSPDLEPPFVPVPTQSAEAEEPLQASVGP